jgi:hypothetical protein
LPRQDADSVTIYDAEVRKQVSAEKTLIQETQSDLRNAYNEILDFDVLYNRFIKPDENAPKFNASLISNSGHPLISRLFILIARYDYLMQIQYTEIQKLKTKAELLIKYFTDKYHF